MEKKIPTQNSNFRKSANSLKKLFLQSQDAVMTLEPPAWYFTSCNPATLKLFKVESEEKYTTLGPWNISPEIQPDGELSSEKAKKMIGAALENGSHFFEWMHCTLDGIEIPCTVLLSKINDKDSTYLQAVVRDISKQKKLENDL